MKLAAFHPLTLFLVYVLTPSAVFLLSRLLDGDKFGPVIERIAVASHIFGVCLLLVGIAVGVHRWINDRRATFLSVVGVVFCAFALTVRVIAYFRYVG
jgi:hypothetical protein